MGVLNKTHFSFVLVCLASITFEAAWSTGVFPSRGDALLVSHRLPAQGGAAGRTRRDAEEPANRDECKAGATPPPTRVDTTQQLTELRALMTTNNVKAYIIPMDDAHQSEYVADTDKRVGFISGFSGSSGRVVVLQTGKAALWSDGRYFLQMNNELDCNWTLMKSGELGTPTVADWLVDELNTGDRVGADPAVMSYDSWITYKTSVEASGLLMVETNNLVDTVWANMGGRPAQPSNDLLVLETQFAGETWQKKVDHIRLGMDGLVDAVVITALDESAWLFNLRGSDIKYNPVFFAYAIVETDKVSLYLYDHTQKLSTIRTHLNTPANGVCVSNANCVNVKSYATFFTDLAALANGGKNSWVSPMSSYAVYSALGTDDAQRLERSFMAPTLVRLYKGRKNPTEVQGMRNSHKRDSAALILFLVELEKGVKAGDYWTEISASDRLEEMRNAEEHNKGLSFATISGVGANGAIIHYKSSNATDTQITTNEMYLLDSGGQYLDGTTDVTRTFHFGTPSDKEKEAYTRVLMGSINLAMAVWPNGTYGRDMDILAREPLWSVGWNYRHGTGHGLGMFLNVHEGPGRINIGYRASQYESPLYGEMFFSDEPGYYEDGEFGIRLETIVMTTKVDTKYQFGDGDYLGFESFTLVPFENNLIMYDLLTVPQRQWLNDYHERCLKEVGETILRDERQNTEAYEWVKARTNPIPEEPVFSGAPSFPLSFITTMLVGLVAFVTRSVIGC